MPRTNVLRDVIKRARGLLVRGLQFARGMQAEERRLRLDRQLIERQMLGRLRDRETEFGRPHPWCLIGAGVDQVERIAIERASRAECRRPSAFSEASSSAWTPSDTRLTPATR